MRARAVWTILVKELTETLRDRRTLFATFVLPVMMHPLIFLLFGAIHASNEAERQALKPDIVVWGPLPAAAQTALEAELGARVVERLALPPAFPAAEVRKLLDARRAHVVLAVEADAERRFAGDESVETAIWFDHVYPLSDGARDRIRDVLKKLSDETLNARLQRHHLPQHFQQPLRLVDEDLSQRARGLELAIPVVLLLVMITAGLLPAIDLTAGEKERGTMQTLLCAPVRPLEIVAGKYLTVVLLTILATIASFAAMTFAVLFGTGALADRGGLSLGPGTIAALFAAMLPAALFIAAVLLALAVFARSFREGQNYLTPVMLAFLLPALMALLKETELDGGTAFIPIANLALLTRQLLRGRVTLQLYGLVMVANFVYALLGVLFAARVFESEQVLLGGERPWRDVFGRTARARVTPSPRNAVLFVAVILVVNFYGQLALTGHVSMLTMVIASQLLFMLLPALLWIRVAGLGLRETLSLYWPSPRGWAGIALITAGGWAVSELVYRFEVLLFPSASAFAEQFTKEVGEIGTGMAIAVAILPAIAEEVCFRGVVLAGLANTGSRWLAIGGSALAFGLMHVHPYRIFIAGLLGVVLGTATLESGSLLAGMAMHFANNGLRTFAAHRPWLQTILDSRAALAAGCASTVAGLLLLRGSRRR